MSKHIIGKGTWLDKLASKLVEREIHLGRSMELIKVESGIGASGIPHIGSLGDAVRAYGVSLALTNIGYNSKLVAYADDMDGLRKIPSGLPSWLKDYLGKPVSNIPDPSGDCHESFSSHMIASLSDSLDKVGVKYELQKASETYQKGILTTQMDRILSMHEELGDKISEYVGQDKYKDSLPYFPVCESCGRLYVARASKYFSEEKKVAYSCIGTTLGNNKIFGCNYNGEVSTTKGMGKMAWKVEFAARWSALDIRFEAYGKDIMDSVRINDWVSDVILGFPHPLHVKYEMFLDKVGKKISKSAGNVLTPQKWLRYGTPQSLLLLLLKRISGTRTIGVEDIPVLMDEYDACEDLFFGKKKEKNYERMLKIKGLYEYINHLQPPDENLEHVPYQLMAQQATLFTQDRIRKIYERLLKYRLVSKLTPELKIKLSCASNWADDYLTTDEKYDINLSESEVEAIIALKSRLQDINDNNSSQSAQDIQNAIYQSARANAIEPIRFFELLYKMLINNTSGPRLGNYILDLGIIRTISILKSYL